ncbi:hypothetical protein Back2_19860 [Nocardioides baekrokdamisoli]|uniref:Bacterial type II secretion system protein E domain-containing protein n=1 Tax=Nocardioides baekrokdamisoli TaxID=1804624 RepID=A0A3G9J3W1_9ACTN|nr:TadA family conjugal transfer-associated ATPase [Nocardioides baekrokdamisoli]BBH17699.1 hypothetical protein Back2_19860 [Nocardioides baekrokdamisoli]
MTLDLPVELVDGVRDWLAREPGDVSVARVASAFRALGRPVGDATVLAVHDHVRREVIGAGPLESLLHLPGVTDVLVNGPAEVYVDRGEGLELTEVRFADDQSVRRLAQRLAASAHRRLDDSVPYVDVRLVDGTRCHAVLSPVGRPGTLISLRVPSARAFSVADLVDAGTVTPAGAKLLEALVSARAAGVISGGTGSGKTTLLAALLGMVPSDERIVIVEDSSELRPDHPHVVALEARLPNVEGAGAVDVRTLVRQALRMRPDRLVVGEARGPEVVDLLTALNTGHEGGLCTVHANAARDVPARLEALAMGAGLDRAATHSQCASGIDVILHVARVGGRRRLEEIAVLEPRPDGLVRARSAIRFGPAIIRGPGYDRLMEIAYPR